MNIIVSILASLYFLIGIMAIISTYIVNKKARTRLKHNQYHLDRANELYAMFDETGDISYLNYAVEELRKVKS